MVVRVEDPKKQIRIKKPKSEDKEKYGSTNKQNRGIKLVEWRLETNLREFGGAKKNKTGINKNTKSEDQKTTSKDQEKTERW